MVLKTAVVPPLETIYEESGSFIASTADAQRRLFSQPLLSNVKQTVTGLISARSVPTVDAQRQRAQAHPARPPIEVRFRDGSKRLIYSSTTKTRSKPHHTGRDDPTAKYVLNGKHRPGLFTAPSNGKPLPSKPTFMLTIITAADLDRARITPTMSSSSSSPDECESSLVSNSSMGTLKTIQEISESSTERLMNANGHSSLPVMIRNSKPTVTVPIRSQHTPWHPSLNIVVSNKEKFLPPTSNGVQVNAPVKPVKQSIPPPAPVLSVRATSSAFRPFFKPMPSNPQAPPPLRPPVPTMNHAPPRYPSQQIVPPSRPQFRPDFASFKNTNFQPMSSLQSAPPKPGSHQPIQRPAQIPRPSLLIPVSSKDCIRTPAPAPKIANPSVNPLLKPPIPNDPNAKWFSITSKSIHDVPHLSSKYFHIPLRITLPMVTPTHNQKLLIKHDATLETRLLNAGLSPETVALYERILDAADASQLTR